MSVWYVELDYYNIGLTLAIGAIVMLLSFTVFYNLWLKNPELKIPTSYHNHKYVFDKSAGFFTKMKILIKDIQNHDYWMSHMGFDGWVISVHKIAVLEKDH